MIEQMHIDSEVFCAKTQDARQVFAELLTFSLSATVPVVYVFCQPHILVECYICYYTCYTCYHHKQGKSSSAWSILCAKYWVDNPWMHNESIVWCTKYQSLLCAGQSMDCINPYFVHNITNPFQLTFPK